MLLVVSNRMINKEAFRNTMSKVWSLGGWLQFKEMGNKKIMVEFQCDQDKIKVMQGRPWTFDKLLICLEDVDWTISPNEMKFAHEPF